VTRTRRSSSTRLSPHFLAAEFAGHDGTPAPPGYLRWARRLCHQFLEPLRSEFGPVTITSGWRSATRNSQVGGAPSSWHLWIPGRAGAAADLICARGTPREWHEALDELGVPGLGFYGDHVHADNRRGRARW
jgi:uncharacterized protein YcbK (DUF882 family)